MIQRVLVLSGYFARRLFWSLSGVIYIILSLIYWLVLFPPGQGTPDLSYYVLVIGVHGGIMAFLATLTVAARANRAANYPLLVRLPSRVEYLTAVLLSSMLFATSVQLLVALLALIGGPELALGRLIEIPPVWVATNILSTVLALHASDFVTSSWSRVYIYGLLAILLVGQSISEPMGGWLATQFATISRLLINGGWPSGGRALVDLSQWLNANSAGVLKNVFGFIFWPFRAVADAIVAGRFEPAQAIAPALLLLYATILFMFAADFFAMKDLDFVE